MSPGNIKVGRRNPSTHLDSNAPGKSNMRRVPPGGTIREELGGVATGQVYSLNSSAVKNLPAMQETQETWVQSLGWEDPLEEGMATYSSMLAWRIPWTEEPGGL